MKFGDNVILIENGEEFVATVFAERVLDDHTGTDGEPLLTVGFFKQPMVPGADGKTLVPKMVLGTSQQHELVQFRTDVAHETHEFSDEAKQNLSVNIYPGPRWRHIDAISVEGDEELSGEEELVDTDDNPDTPPEPSRKRKKAKK